MRKFTALMFPMALLVVTVACGDSKSPIAPTPAPAPAPAPAPEPTPAPTPSPTPAPTPAPAPTPEPGPTPPPSPSPAPSPTPDPGGPAPAPTPAPMPPLVTGFVADTDSPAERSYSLELAKVEGDEVFVYLKGNGFGSGASNNLKGVRVTLNYDPNVVAMQAFARGSYLPGTYVVTQPGSGRVRIHVDGDSAASGTGIIVRLRFLKVSSGSTRIDYESAEALNGAGANVLAATHGGTLTVQ